MKAAEWLDGKFVVHANDDTLRSDDAMAPGYRQLKRVEQAWRQMKNGPGTARAIIVPSAGSGLTSR